MRLLVLTVFTVMTLSLCGVSSGEVQEPVNIQDSIYGDVYFGKGDATLSQEASPAARRLPAVRIGPDAVGCIPGAEDLR